MDANFKMSKKTQSKIVTNALAPTQDHLHNIPIIFGWTIFCIKRKWVPSPPYFIIDINVEHVLKKVEIGYGFKLNFKLNTFGYYLSSYLIWNPFIDFH